MSKSKKNDEQKKKKKKWLLLLLLLLLLCFLGILIFKVGFNVGKSQKPVSPDPTPQRMIIAISDDDGKWKTGNGKGGNETVNNIRIFSTSAETRYVAPYDKGKYEFDVKNTISKNITYSLSLEEDNADKVNIKYKLKKNGNYIMGEYNWVYYNEIDLKEITLQAGATDSYELEWSWVSENDELDTKIGLKDERATYKLTINVVAVEEDVER